MDWGALIGGLIGAGIPAILTYQGLRRARQSSDAEAFGPAVLLLDSLHPDRISINVSSDSQVEAVKWADLAQRNDVARERLLVVSAGHPRRQVRELAKEADIKLANAYQASGWQAHDLQHHQGDSEWRKTALQRHAEAEAAVRDLIDENFKWGPLSWAEAFLTP